jgi:hypothetical protein
MRNESGVPDPRIDDDRADIGDVHADDTTGGDRPRRDAGLVAAFLSRSAASWRPR